MRFLGPGARSSQTRVSQGLEATKHKITNVLRFGALIALRVYILRIFHLKHKFLGDIWATCVSGFWSFICPSEVVRTSVASGFSLQRWKRR